MNFSHPGLPVNFSNELFSASHPHLDESNIHIESQDESQIPSDQSPMRPSGLFHQRKKSAPKSNVDNRRIKIRMMSEQLLLKMAELQDRCADDSDPLTQQQRQLLKAQLQRRKNLDQMLKHAPQGSLKRKRHTMKRQNVNSMSPDNKAGYPVGNIKKNNIDKDSVEREIFPQLYYQKHMTSVHPSF